MINEDITPCNAHITPIEIEGQIIIARVRQLNLNLEVSSFMLLYVTVENDLLPNDLRVIRNMREEQEG
jgi:hypothetical protein